MESMKYNNEICKKCMEKKDRMASYIHGRECKIVTMGPQGTTSSQAARYFQNYAINELGADSMKISLYDTFEIALKELKGGDPDFIILPNAYNKMTNFYWDNKLELMFTFIIQTPEYGIAALDMDTVSEKQKISIATCKAVEHLVSDMWNELNLQDKEYTIVEAYSTTKSLMLLEEGRVDFALTNNSSMENSNAFFVTQTIHTEVLWSVFMVKKYINEQEKSL